MTSIADFFAFANERHSIYLRRKAGLPRSEWTTDPILQQYRFTNVFRELDKVTIWFRENVRDRYAGLPEALLATVVFRWFNRIESGRAIFCQADLLSGKTPFEVLLSDREQGLKSIKAALIQYCGKGPYVTGSYIIKTPNGYNKLDGVIKCIEWFMTQEKDFLEHPTTQLILSYAHLAQSGGFTLKDAWEWLKQYPYMGGFTAYEVITDLRHTELLNTATDVMTWANPGPGAKRGLNRIHGRHLDDTSKRIDFIKEMQDILALVPTYWEHPEKWEMRDVEHTLCEADKYQRVLKGEGKPRGVYR